MAALQRKIFATLLTLTVLVCSIPVMLCKHKIDTDISVLLPDDEWISGHLNFLRDSQLGNLVAISLSSPGGKEGFGELANFADRLADKIACYPGVRRVASRFEPEEALAAGRVLFKGIAQTLDGSDLNDVAGRIGLSRLEQIMRGHYDALLRPGGIFQQKIIAADPLNLHEIPLNRLQRLGQESGFRMEIRDSRLWNGEHSSMLLVVETSIPVTDADAAEALYSRLDEDIARISRGHDILCVALSGHRHAMDNQRLLKHDIMVTMFVAGMGFLLLFLIFFRDWMAIVIFVIPVAGVQCAIGLTMLFFERPSAIILGLGTTVVGIALDYGLHVYVASSLHEGEAREKALQAIRRPLVFSALTTLGVFWAFLLSGTPGYRQLAFASTCGLVFSLLFSMICLPSLLPKNRRVKTWMPRIASRFPTRSREYYSKAVLAGALIASVAIVVAMFSNFEKDIRQLDGLSDELRSDKTAFATVWGEMSRAAATISGENVEDLHIRHDLLAKSAKAAGVPGFDSLSLLWPSLPTREANASAWDEFWRGGKACELRGNLAKAGEKYGFSHTAFEPFFQNLYKHDFSEDLVGNPDFAILTRRFIFTDGSEVVMNAFFDDDEEAVKQVAKMLEDTPGAMVISPSMFGSYISEKIMDDAAKIAVIAVFCVCALAFLCLKRLSKTLVALLPVLFATLAVWPAFAVCGLKLNAVSLVACIVVVGLAIDYGIFVVSSCDKRDPAFSMSALYALSISALSTLVGASALLWASHPALRSVGLTITSGVTAAYITAVLLSPAVYTLTISSKTQDKTPKPSEETKHPA
ncbi:MAG: MMPL family transporter [Victivallales bacterium]|nr:MMPL family transporter [Victivallales bacterium]